MEGRVTIVSRGEAEIICVTQFLNVSFVFVSSFSLSLILFWCMARTVAVAPPQVVVLLLLAVRLVVGLLPFGSICPAVRGRATSHHYAHRTGVQREVV